VTTAGLLLSVGAVVAAGVLALGEIRWRRRIAAELSDEIDLGILAPEDFRALSGWTRFRKSWLAASRERRAFSRIAGRLARAKAAQRKAQGEQRRLLQVQVLTLRTRLRTVGRNGLDRREG
jgi:hypothetical protein